MSPHSKEVSNTADNIIEQNILANAIQTIGTMIFVYDLANHHISYVNAEFSRQLGYTPEEIAAMGDKLIPSLVHQYDLNPVNAAMQQAAALMDGQRLEVEYRLKTVKNEWRWYKSSFTPYTRTAEQVTQVLGVGYDITARKQTESDLLESQRLLQSVLDAIPVRLFWKDRNSTFLGCNRLVAQDAGLSSAKEIIGKNDFMLTPDQAELYQADDRAVMQSGKAKLNYEEQQTSSDGKQSWLRTSKIPLKNNNEEIIGVIGAYEDITEYKQAEQALRESEQRYRAMINLIPDLIFRTNRDGICLNVKLTSDFKGAAEQFIGKPLSDLLPAPIVKLLLKSVGRALDTSKSQTCEYSMPREGVEHYYEARMLVSAQDEVLVITRDVTEDKRATAEREALQQQLIDAQKQALLELSTPIIPMMDQIIVLPLIGSIDTARAQEITRTLLRGITQHRAQIVIIDITGVPVVDTGVADHLNRTIQAARLKGAHTIVTGISDAVAETIVDLGIDWGKIETLRDLQSGLISAFKRIGMRLSVARS